MRIKVVFHSPLFLLFALFASSAVQAKDYFPDRKNWQPINATEAGFDSNKLAQAVKYAHEKAQTEPSDMRKVLLDNYTNKEPNYRILGPVKNRVAASGMIISQGKILASWGDIDRAEMTFSVVKSYLATLVAIAIADGLITSVDDKVAQYVFTDHFTEGDNQLITWRHLLEQNSDWQGRLWAVDDWADRPEGEDRSQWSNRKKHKPGTQFKYNDVRVNLLAYALTQVFHQPLPKVLRERILRPIGASNSWQWHGYKNSWVNISGTRMQSVSGGGHFGGGMFINTQDHARFGLLMARKGRWNSSQLISQAWQAQAIQPSKSNDAYGFLWWLNTNQKAISAAPEHLYWAAGFGGHFIVVDDQNDLVIVLRWVPDMAGVVNRIYAAKK